MNTFETFALAKCKCRNCDQKIEFQRTRAGESVTCPSCGMDTVLFIPATSIAPGPEKSEPLPGHKNMAIVFMMIGLLSFIGLIVALCDKEEFPGVNPALFFILTICSGILYFMPSLIASKKSQFIAIFALNLLLGWTFIGWVAALIWSLVKEKA